MNYPKLYSGQKLNQYTLTKELGKGSFGIVYEAKNNRGKIVAIKSMLLSRYKECGGIVGQLVENEKLALQKIRSNNVIRLYDYFETEGQGVFVLEYCDSGTLHDIWEQNHCCFPPGIALNYFKQILKGMRALHEQKIVHRDLKLANILVHQNQIKIADLGFCDLLKNQDSLLYLNLGSLGTKAPETVENKPYGLQADMFGVGVILYQMIFSKYPFSSHNEKDFLADVKLKNPPKYKLENGAAIDPTVTNLLTQMLKYDPNQRLKWSELFQNKIFMGQSSLINLRDQSQYLADIDPDKSRIFYHGLEKQEKDYITQNPKNADQLQQEIQKTKKLFVYPKTIQEQPINDSSTKQFNQQSFDESEQINYAEIQSSIISNYIIQKYPISWVSISYNEMKQFYHKQVFDSIFVSYLLIKLIYFKHHQLRSEIKQGEHYEKLFKSETFQSFMREFEEENELLFVHLNLEFQAVQANYPKLQKYLQPNWSCEVFQMAPTKDFQVIYKEALQKYIKTIYQQIQNSKQQLQLLYISRLINCLNYDQLKQQKDLDKQNISLQQMNEKQLLEYINSKINF